MYPDVTIGITGGIGSGKSVVSRVLRCNGFKVYDCDASAKILMKTQKEVKHALTSRFGARVYLETGELNKNLLSQLIFSDESNRDYINRIVHKAVREDIKEIKKNTKGIFFIETAIPMTGKIDQFCDQIWIVEASEKTRIERVEKRDKINKEEILKRIEAQRSELEGLENEEVLRLKNNAESPLLREILKLTNRLNNQQTYSILC